MRYGYFDDANREYVIDRVNTPAPWTNYIGVNDMCAVLISKGGKKILLDGRRPVRSPFAARGARIGLPL